MKIKSLIIVDDNGKEYAFTHRSIVEVEEYKAAQDPEVQGTGLAELQVDETGSTPVRKVEKNLKAKKKK